VEILFDPAKTDTPVFAGGKLFYPVVFANDAEVPSAFKI